MFGVKNIAGRGCVQSLIVAFLLFLVMLGPRIGVVDFSVVFLLLTAPVALYFLLKKGSPWSFLLHEKFFLYLLAYALIIFSLEGSLDINEYGQYFFRVLRSTLFYAFLMLLYYQFKIPFRTICIGFVSVLVFNLVVTYFQIFDFFGLREFFVKLNTLAPKELNPFEYAHVVMGGVRSRGLLKGFDSNSITISSLLFFALFFTRNKLIQFLAIILVIVGTFLSARVGIVASFAVLFFFVLHNLVRNPKTLIIFLPVLLMASTVIYFVVPSLPNKTVTRLTVGDKSRPLLKRITSVNDLLENHLTLKNIDSPRIYFLGKASKQNVKHSRNVLTSDVGYIQVLYNFGVPNLILLILIHLWIVYEAKTGGNPVYPIYGYAVLILFLLSLKGPYFFSRTVYDLIVLIFFHHAVFLKDQSPYIEKKS